MEKEIDEIKKEIHRLTDKLCDLVEKYEFNKATTRPICGICGKPKARGEDSDAFEEIRRCGAEPPEDWVDFEGNNLCWIDIANTCTPELVEEDYLYRISRLLGYRIGLSIEEIHEVMSKGKPIGR